MKLLFLFLLLFSFKVFAEFKVDVCHRDNSAACAELNPVGDPNFSATFQTEAEAQAWVADQEKPVMQDRSSWGLLERLVPLEGASDEDRALSIEVIPANEEAGTPSMLKLRKMYSHIIRDVTAKVSAEKAMAAAMAVAYKAIDCGKSAQALLLVRNGSKNLSTAQVKTLVSATAPIKQLLDTGSLTSALEEIQAVSADGVVITEDDKAALVNHINSCKP